MKRVILIAKEHTPDKMRSQVCSGIHPNRVSKQPKFVLASSSPRREEALRELGIRYRKAPAQIRENRKRGEDPRAMAIRLATRKVEAAPDLGGITLGMDTIVVLGSAILGKPKNKEDAAAMLTSLSGRMHLVITGVALRLHNRIVVDAETTRVFFRRMGKKEIEWYVQTGEPFDKAGAYGIQGGARLFVRKIDGCFFNVVGFPIYCFQRALAKFGFTVYDFMSDSGGRASVPAR
jgi:septum formation protein